MIKKVLKTKIGVLSVLMVNNNMKHGVYFTYGNTGRHNSGVLASKRMQFYSKQIYDVFHVKFHERSYAEWVKMIDISV